MQWYSFDLGIFVFHSPLKIVNVDKWRLTELRRPGANDWALFTSFVFCSVIHAQTPYDRNWSYPIKSSANFSMTANRSRSISPSRHHTSYPHIYTHLDYVSPYSVKIFRGITILRSTNTYTMNQQWKHKCYPSPLSYLTYSISTFSQGPQFPTLSPFPHKLPAKTKYHTHQTIYSFL